MGLLTSTGFAIGYRPGRQGRATGLALRVLEHLNGWVERYRQRRTLLELNDHMLKDIGVSRADAEREGYKPFWRP